MDLIQKEQFEPAFHPIMPTTLKNPSKIRTFFRKYFLEGQSIEDSHRQHLIATLDPDQKRLPFLEKHRKLIGFLIPFCFMHLCWWTLAVRYNIFELYPTHYQMPITMILGATVAGCTSEGGGAVAFPVMTLLLKIPPTVARDFSFMIQSCGMTSAAFTIFWMKIKLEWNSIVFCTIGSTLGVILGLEFVDQLIPAATKKMLFVAIWFSFALSLWLLNTQKKRTTFETIQKMCAWKVGILLLTGFVGGLCSAFAGSGVDICSFSILTLLFRVSEKIATPTSVVLMAANTCVGFFWRQLIMDQIDQLAWNYFKCSVPVVVICAPLGSLLGSHLHRLVLASFVYILEIVALVGFLFTAPPLVLIAAGAAIICGSFLFFLGISKIGQKLEEKEKRHFPLHRQLSNDTP